METTLTGRYGIVVIPDKRTLKMAEAIAAALLLDVNGYSCKYICGGASLPHITLYHTQFNNLPLHEAKEAVKAAKTLLAGQQFWMSDIKAFHDNFIFWNVVDGDRKLFLAHQQALGLSKYLNLVAAANSLKKEQLELTTAEQKNHTKYGHPLCDSLFTPHITLACTIAQADKILPSTAVLFNWPFQVDRVALAEIGDLGQVVDILL